MVNQNNQGGSAVATTGVSGVQIDKNKSAEQYIKEVEAKYIVPPLVREKFSDLVKLIYETESMDLEEREYWLQIMPIMSEEQVVKLRDILVNEKEQLEKLDNEYSNGTSRMEKKVMPEIDEAKMKEKMAEIKAAEEHSEKREESEAEAVLKKLGEL